MGNLGVHFVLGTALLMLGGCGAPWVVHDDAAGAADDAFDAPRGSPDSTDEFDPASLPTSDAHPEASETRSDAAAGVGTVFTGSRPTGPSSPAALDLTAPPPALDSASPLFDPLGFGAFEPTDVPDLLSLYLDGLVIDLVDPVGPVGPGDGLTFLELLCIDLGEPEHVCRQRYGR